MFGLCDIPCVSVFVDKVSEYTVEALFRGLKYLFCYKALVDNLNSEIVDLNIEKDRISRKVTEEKANGNEIEGHVLTWQNDVVEIQKSGEELSPSCSCIQCLPIANPISRFQIGRSAVKKAERVTKLTTSGKEHLTRGIAYVPEVISMPNPQTTFEEFQSRIDVYEKLWDALVDETSPLIHGIYGTAGVGKTRMMQKIWEDAMNKKKFKKVVRVNVGSEKLDNIKLQDQIAARLNCNLNSRDEESRASQLGKSLRNEGKILLVLDDVWRKIPLVSIIGTSFVDGSCSKGSKILLTSRDKEVCLLNQCERLVEIKTLSHGEALDLFKKVVGPHKIKTLQDETLIKEVCDECGRLPLLILAVGNALQHKLHISWKDAHNQLKMGNIGKVAGEDPYACIKLSIDNLIDDDARLCLFVCSLFPEDADIDEKILIQLCSQLIPDGELRILAIVDSLKTSSLLLDSGWDNRIKVHDIIRDVARNIAFSEYAFSHVKCNSEYFAFDASYSTRKILRLDVETEDVQFKEDEVYPDMHTLWLQCNNDPQRLSGGFFGMFLNLSSLMLENVNISVEQFSLQPLANLWTLALLKCDIRKTGIRPFPENLKALCIWDCDLPRPLDVANLKYLRKLEIQQRNELVMVPNVISSLSNLVELHLPNGFIIDGEEKQMKFVEISKLTHLRSLQFNFHDDDIFQGTNVFSNLIRYNILVGEQKNSDIPLLSRNKSIGRVQYWRVPFTRSIWLYGNQAQCWEGLMARAQSVKLCRSDYCQVRFDHISFEDLQTLYIRKCNKLGHVASIWQDEIQSSLQRASCFSRLTFLEINSCSKMKYLFCNNIARSLVQLQHLIVHGCKSMEAIIMNEGTSDGDIINFSKLKSLRILSTPLVSFYVVEKENMISGSTLLTDNSAQYQPLFDGMVAFPSLEQLYLWNLPNTSVIWGNDCFNDSLSSFCKLNYLDIFNCNKLEITMIPQAMLHRLESLEFISVSCCHSLRTMLRPSAASDLTHLKTMTTDGTLFPELRRLYLENLPSLTSFVCYQREKANTRKVRFTLPHLSDVTLKRLPNLKSFFHGSNFEFHVPALKVVNVQTCGLSTLFTFSTFRSFHLEKLTVHDCELVEHIVEGLRGDETCDKIIALSQLTEVEFEKLPNLKSFFHNANYEFHMPVMKKVKVLKCGLSNALFTRSVFKSLKQLEELSVCDCELLEGIFVDGRSDDTLDRSDKIITLNRVSIIHFQGLPKFKSIFYGATYECYMPALKKVKIVGCGLSVLFTFSVFQKFQQIEILHISNCESLEHIVEEVGGDETPEMNGKIIKSPKLSSITLESLPNLKSFGCTSSYVFNMPKLKNFRFVKCPQIEYFCSSETKTSSVRVTGDWCSEEDFQDLDDFIRQNHKRGSYLNDSAGQTSYSRRELGTQSEIIEEEKPHEIETDLHEGSI